MQVVDMAVWRSGGLTRGICLMAHRGSSLGDILLVRLYADEVPYLHITVCYATSERFYAMSETVQ